MELARGRSLLDCFRDDQDQFVFKRPTDDLDADGEAFEQVLYEGYGPAGVAMLIEAMTDNRNRTVAEIRSLFTKNHGNMAEAGAVAWQFHKKGLLTIDKAKVGEDALLSLALDAGAEDVKVGEKSFEVVTNPQDFEAVKKARAPHPDLVVMDLDMPNGDGITATRSLQEKLPGVRVLVVTMHTEEEKLQIAKRAGWLCALFLGEMLTATAMGYFEGEISKAVVLALFIPLIISSGGNSGSQATSLIIRALALREVTVGDWWRIAVREVPAGVALGSILGAIGIVRISAWQVLGFYDYGPHWPLIATTSSSPTSL